MRTARVLAGARSRCAIHSRRPTGSPRPTRPCSSCPAGARCAAPSGRPSSGAPRRRRRPRTCRTGRAGPSGTLCRPDPRAALRAQWVLLVVPVVPVADDVHRLGVRRPDGEPHAIAVRRRRAPNGAAPSTSHSRRWLPSPNRMEVDVAEQHGCAGYDPTGPERDAAVPTPGRGTTVERRARRDALLGVPTPRRRRHGGPRRRVGAGAGAGGPRGGRAHAPPPGRCPTTR